MDTLDGRYSRMSGKGTPFGAFLDSTLDRIEEGIVLTAVAGYFALRGDRVAAAAVVVAVLASLMVSYTRARAEALGVECKVGIATRPVRVVILSIGLIFAQGAVARKLPTAGARGVRAGGAEPDHGRPAHRRTCAASCRRPHRRPCDCKRPAGSLPSPLGPAAGRTAQTARSHPGSSTGPSAPQEGNELDPHSPQQRRRAQRRLAKRRRALPARQGPRRDRRRRQLRLGVRPGRPALPRRRSLPATCPA